jgi:lipoprotein-releasing system permease protein
LISLIQISWRFLKGRNSSGLISFSFYLSIFGLGIGTASLLLISAFSNGFSSEVQSKLATIDGEIRIEKYSNSLISIDEINKIQESLNIIPGINKFYTYSQTHAMLQTGQQSDGSLLFGVKNNLFLTLSSHSKLYPTNIIFEGNSIVLGYKVAENLGLEIGDQVNLFDLDLLTNSKQIKGLSLKLIGTIETGFSEYDKLISFIPQNIYQNFYSTESKYSGLILDVISNNTAELANEIRENINFPFIINTWEERHSVLLQWMNIYHIPIQMVMGFITLLAIFNINSTLWMISIDKTGNVGILKAMGYSKHQLKNIFIIKGIIISSIGIIIGLVLSMSIYFLQNNYQIISLSSDVYFLDYLPILPNIKESLIIIGGIFISTLLLSNIPANIVKNINPAVALKEN